VVKLNIGCGDDILEGYINIDSHTDHEGVVRIDFVSYAKDIPDNHFDRIRCEAVLEHIPHQNAPYFLSEIFRILKRGCRARIVVPDMDFLCNLWTYSTPYYRVAYLKDKIFGNQNHGGEFHLSPWNEDILGEHLQDTGFSYELWPSWDYNQKVICVEATKP
jgi:predicted SAM-dependent methyltransferase